MLYVEGIANGDAVLTLTVTQQATSHVLTTDSVRIAVNSVDLIGHTPETAPFVRQQIPFANEEDPGVYIRRNGDNDATEDDLVKVLLDTAFAAPAGSGGDVPEGMVLFVVMHYGKVSRVHMVEAIAPLLGASRDAKLEEACVEVAAVIEGGGTAGPDYSYYRNYLDVQIRANQRVADGFVEHMFRRSPGQAVQTFAMVVYQDERRKPFLWARHVVDDALWKRQHGFAPPKEPDAAVTEQLATMAEREEFWARLYAAEIIRQHPEFGTEELARRLAEDSHPLVAKTAKSIRTPAKVRDE